MKRYPVTFVWQTVDLIDATDGTVERRLAMVPQGRYARIAEQQFAEGEPHTLAPLEPRSLAAHNHYFAALKDGFENLPEQLAKSFPTQEHLRKWLLIATGQFDIVTWHSLTKREAFHNAKLVRGNEPYARIKVFETVEEETKAICWAVEIKRAVSQSSKTMGKEAFQESKTKVLDMLEEILRIKTGTLMKEAGRHA
jgi:hypothetical protein